MRQTTTVKRTAVIPPVLKNRFGVPLAQKAKSNDDLNGKIAQKAYDLYVERGCEHGHDVEDWIRAERIVKGL